MPFPDPGATQGRRWLVLNPNTDPGITRGLVDAVERHAPGGTRVVGATARFGFPVIATRASYAVAAHAAVDAYAHRQGDFDAILLGCFGDPGLAALRELSDVPVVGLAEASFAAAHGPFAVLTAGPAWKPMLLEQVAVLGHAAMCRGVWALDATGGAVSRSPEAFVDALDALAAQAVAAGAKFLILGGAVLAGYARRLRPVARFIDCVGAAVAHIPSAVAERSATLQPQPATGLSPALCEMLRILRPSAGAS